MRIGIDARTILHPHTKDAIGLGHYTFHLIKHLLELDQKNSYVLFFDKDTREKDIKRFTKENVKIVYFPFSAYTKFLPGMYNEILTSAMLKKEELDILHMISPLARVPVSYRGKVVTTVHDLGMYKVPENYRKMRVAHTKAITALTIKRAQHVIAASQALKKDVVDMFSRDPQTITTVYTGLDQRFHTPKNDSQKKVPKKFGITKKYILFLGTVHPVKNITRLLHAFSLFSEKRRQLHASDTSDYQLLIAGKPGWLSRDIKNFVHDLDVDRDVKFTGYITGDEVLPLFHHAEFFVSPSLYEGFGSTVIEAFAAGTPVIASKVGSVPEIAGDAAHLINPMDTHEITEALEKFARDKELRKSYAGKGQIRAKDFSWEKTAKQTLEVYKKMMQ